MCAGGSAFRCPIGVVKKPIGREQLEHGIGTFKHVPYVVVYSFYKIISICCRVALSQIQLCEDVAKIVDARLFLPLFHIWLLSCQNRDDNQAPHSSLHDNRLKGSF